LIKQLDLHNYLLGDVLGVGTAGTIYAAVDNKTQTPVAVKRLHPGVSRDPVIRGRFEREMIILARLQHPNIIRYFGGGEQDGQLFYVMELVDGGTVKDLLQSRGRFQWPVVVELARQICSALQCAHNHGVIHRDLKPGNLFLNRDGELKLGDFGIARDLTHSDLTDAGMTVGTHAYMAPEQITGDSRINGQVDLYALGCCLFEMLVGRKVYQGENFAQLFEQHLRGTPQRIRQFVPECPIELDEIVNQLLHKNPLDRPFNARAVQGVMLQLQAKNGEPASSVTLEPTSKVSDVAADNVSGDGRSMLRDQISQSFERTDGRDFRWLRALIAAIGLIVIIGLATWLSR
jgi:eukaryotic-like serine/threonine-protein kinase